MSLVHTNDAQTLFFLSNAIRWKERIFELVDRAALAGIAGTDIAKQRSRPLI
jgi:hypothetical protein